MKTHFCTPSPYPGVRAVIIASPPPLIISPVQAAIRTSFEELYRVMSQREEFRWMMLRIKRMAEPWVSAIRSLAAKQNLARRRRKKVSMLYAMHCCALDPERERERGLSGRQSLFAACRWLFVDILMARPAAHHRSLHFYFLFSPLCVVLLVQSISYRT